MNATQTIEAESKVELVGPDWLEERLDDPGLRIVDTQPNIHDYIQEHIPGALYFNQDLLRVPFEGLPGEYIPAPAAKLLFDRIGLDGGQQTLVYSGVGPFKGWGDGLEQSMLAYSMIRFGHNRIKVLDGGIERWKAEGGRTAKEFPNMVGGDFKVEVRRNFFVGYNEFKNLLKDEEDVVVLDARPPELYSGKGPWQKPGHIPGAVNLPWRTLMDDDNPRLFKPLDGIRERIEAMGIDHYREVICTCGTGREATLEFLLFKYHLYFPKVRIYEGSFTEWSAHPENKTVIGKDPG